MYRNAYQRGMLTVFFSMGAKPLANWETYIKNGYISRFLDQDLKSMVLEIGGTNVSTTYMICPKGKQVLGICMPFLIMIVKNLKKYFTFEVTILDETGTRRRFRVSNFQSSTQVLPLCTVMPIGLSDGWNQIQFNLAEFTRRAYKKQFIEVQKLKINANIRLRRIYFTERLIPEDELPPEYKLYFPIAAKGHKVKKLSKENETNDNILPMPSKQAVELSVVEQKTSLKEIKKPSKENETNDNIMPLPSKQPVVEQRTSSQEFKKPSKVSIHSVHKSLSHVSKMSEEKNYSQKHLSTEGSVTQISSKVLKENIITPQSGVELSGNLVEIEAETSQEPQVTEEIINKDEIVAEVTEETPVTEEPDQENTPAVDVGQ